MVRTLSEAEKAEKRTKLIKLATHILERDGEAGLTARGLAREAGISRTTPYLYFKDKQAILNGIRLASLEKITAQFQKSTEANPILQMREFGEIYTIFGLKHPELYRLIFTSDFSLKPMPDELNDALEHFQSIMFAPMVVAYDAGLLSMPPKRLNLVMWSCIHGLLTLSHSGLFENDEVLPQLRQDIGRILSQGFLVRGKNDD